MWTSFEQELMERRVWSSAVTNIPLKWEGKKKALLEQHRVFLFGYTLPRTYPGWGTRQIDQL